MHFSFGKRFRSGNEDHCGSVNVMLFRLANFVLETTNIIVAASTSFSRLANDFVLETTNIVV